MPHSVDDARGAIKTGHLRYILGLSLAGAILGLGLALAFAG